jgi:hypothetical protein
LAKKKLDKPISMFYLAINKILNSIIHPTFSKATGAEFSKALRKRVNTYFKTHDMSKNANGSMIGKTVGAAYWYWGPAGAPL